MSNRPDFVKEEDIIRWSIELDKDLRLKNITGTPTLKEVCFAGMYLSEELEKLGCPQDLIVRIQYTAGMMSFGRDAWEVSLLLIDKYKKQELEFELDEVN